MNQDENKTKTMLFNGGLAEIVSQPSELTYSFLAYWFTGKVSLGKTMALLGLPYEAIGIPILTIKDGQLYIDLTSEEKTLYESTIFSYKRQQTPHQTPILSLNPLKCFSIKNLIRSGRILLRQGQWIAKQKETQAFAKKMVDSIPDVTETTINEIDAILGNDVWPRVIAVGLLSEYYHQVLVHDFQKRKEWNDLQLYISQQVSKQDWFFLSIKDQEKVFEKKLSLKNYMKSYGLRADNDYELTSPRWIEIPEEIEKRINMSSDIKIKAKEDMTLKDNQMKKGADSLVAFLLLRSEARKKVLPFLFALRKNIQKHAKGEDISTITRDELLAGNVTLYKKKEKKEKNKLATQSVNKGKGIGVSPGTVVGKTLRITSVNMEIPKDTIGVFPDASPMYAPLFPKCKGMIFLKGGQTSHGAIVAREFGIPALIDPSAEGIEEKENCTINGETGEWKPA